MLFSIHSTFFADILSINDSQILQKRSRKRDSPLMRAASPAPLLILMLFFSPQSLGQNVHQFLLLLFQGT